MNPIFRQFGDDDSDGYDDRYDCEDHNDDDLETWKPSPRSLVSGIRPEISGRGPGVSGMGKCAICDIMAIIIIIFTIFIVIVIIV